ncbi:hypothetical protein QBC37DRAFT_369959 [Rhypophila decipiens]|uniref:Clr5 domain-containing protein n=1 Tax=Rhypophila decipiens TaxID=261697 RepID=A0AAN6YH20_9PEZI|nr:hypothetical protein QBC37DRAFT_369959 [Rhypophila decipiens]
MASLVPPSLDSSDGQSETTAVRPKGKWATTEEWVAVRPMIRKMYMEDNVPLKEVMAIMETQHGFHGTIKMYKNKLNEWGFFKTYKPREVLDALRSLEARKAAGEEHPTTSMRGVEVDIGWIRDYMKRNRKRINKIARSQAQASASATSSASPPAMNDPKAVVTATGAIRVAEELLTTMNLYVDNAMSSGMWFVDTIGFYRSKKGNTGTYFLYDFWDRLDEASQAMSRAQEIDLLELLNPAFTRLNDIVREEDPRSFPFLLGCFEVLRLRGRSDLLETFLKYIWQLSSALLGPNYPHSQIWKQAYRMFRMGTHEELMEQVFMLLMDRYHSQGTQEMMVAAQLLGGHDINPYLRKCGSGLHIAYKVCLEKLELTIKQQLERLEADEQARLSSSVEGVTTEQAKASSSSSTEKTAGPPPPTPSEVRDRLANLRADYTAGVLGILRSQGQFREAQEALDVLAGPVSNPLYSAPSPSTSRSPSPTSETPLPCLNSSQTSANFPLIPPNTTSQNKPKRLKQPDKLTRLVSLVESKLQDGNMTSADHLHRLVEHLVDNPSVYRDEGWINWIFEGLANVPRLATTDSASRQKLIQNRAFRLAKEREWVLDEASGTTSMDGLSRSSSGPGGEEGMVDLADILGLRKDTRDTRDPGSVLNNMKLCAAVRDFAAGTTAALTTMVGSPGGTVIPAVTRRGGRRTARRRQSSGLGVADSPAATAWLEQVQEQNRREAAPVPVDKIYEMETICRGSLNYMYSTPR